MAKRTYVETGVKITSTSATGSFNDISQYITGISGFNVEALTQETHAMGDSFPEHTWVGVKRIDDITLDGFHDDVAATGPHALLGYSNLGTERVLKIYADTAQSYKVDVIVAKYSLMPKRNELTPFQCVLRPTGAFVTST